jgi:uncharacterized protein YkwD
MKQLLAQTIILKIGKDEQKEVVEQINRIRGNHKVNPLKLDKKLVEDAEKWAKKMAKNDKPESGNSEDQGECLFTYRYNTRKYSPFYRIPAVRISSSRVQ